MIGRALKGIKRPAPRVPSKPATSIEGRGGISMPAFNPFKPVTGLPSKPTPSIPTPVNPSPNKTILPSNPATSIEGRGGISMPAIDTRTNKTVLPSNPAGGGATTGFKSGSGGFASSLFGHGTPAGGGATSVNNIGTGPGLGVRADFGPIFKKGGKVKAAKASAPKASSASKRADGCAIRGKTKGKMV